MKDTTTTTDIVKMHKKCLDLFLKNQSLIYSVEIKNISGTLCIGVHFVREKFPHELPWITFYAFQSAQISSKKLAAIKEYLLTGKADFSKMQ